MVLLLAPGSIVTKDVKPYSIVGGSPARQIRFRFAQQIIDRIEKIRWWEYNILGLQLPWDDVEKTLDKLQKMISEKEISRYTPKQIRLT